MIHLIKYYTIFENKPIVDVRYLRLVMMQNKFIFGVFYLMTIEVLRQLKHNSFKSKSYLQQLYVLSLGEFTSRIYE